MLLDSTADLDHNRSVFTFAGTPPVVVAAVYALVDVAVRAIDLRTHHGVHPRLGAVDVIPFVPLGDSTLEDCARVAREVGATVAERYALPVYLYGAAASAPYRRGLEHVRQGQFEGLAEKMRLPEWAPDFGPATPHQTAGASVIGARLPLIAFNVNLATDRVDIAKAIAAEVRHSSGGLPSVKALGLPLPQRGQVQVSMNLMDFRETSLDRAFHAVADGAARRGVHIVESEIVGLVPAEALAAAGASAAQVAGFRPEMLLEVQLLNRLNQARRP